MCTFVRIIDFRAKNIQMSKFDSIIHFGAKINNALTTEHGGVKCHQIATPLRTGDPPKSSGTGWGTFPTMFKFVPTIHLDKIPQCIIHGTWQDEMPPKNQLLRTGDPPKKFALIRTKSHNV